MTTDSIALREAWVEHRFYKYRGCAPAPDNPRRMAGNPDLPVGAHHAPDVDGGEPQDVRIAREDAAIEVCLNCPVMVACDLYANSVTRDGRLAEPDGVWGGRRALERHRAFIATRHQVVAAAASDRALRTPQKLAVLAALAVETDPYAVARAAGMDVRTANWQRSKLTTLLGLPRDASRGELLEAARGRGLLEDVTVVADDGSVPAVPPPTRMPADDQAPAPAPVVAAAPAPVSGPSPAAVPGCAPAPCSGGPEVEPVGPLRLHAPRRDRFAAVHGQLTLDDALAPGSTGPDVAPVIPLFPHHACLEAAV
jgi:hypothetical protein